MALVSALLWGLWWIPIRYLEGIGLAGAWGGVAMNAGAFLAALFWMAARGAPGLGLTWRAFLGAGCVGAAVATYSASLNHTDVVRAVLLFYLAPAWSKIIEWAFLGVPWRWTSTAALGASVCGAFFVLGGGFSLQAIGVGDLLALASGVAWAVGAALIFSGGAVRAMPLTVVTAAFAVLLALPFAGSVDALQVRSLGIGAAFGAVYALPILLLTLWSAQRLAPATISFILTAEILSGVVSSAILLDEPFGLLQYSGAVLIVLAATSEVAAGAGRARTEMR